MKTIEKQGQGVRTAPGLEAATSRPEATDTADLQRERANRAHRAAVAQFPKAVIGLEALIGAPLVAYIANVTEQRAVRQWKTGERLPHPTTQTKVRLALHIAEFLRTEGEEGAIEAWFQGLNPALDDQTPADLLREAERTDLSLKGRAILAAAREFAES